MSSKTELHWVDHRGYRGYRKCVGYALNAKGTKKEQKFWYLGQDHSKALQILLSIQSEWMRLKEGGEQIWTKDAINRVQDFKRSLYEEPDDSPISRAEPKNDTENSIQTETTFYQSIKDYVRKVVPSLPASPQWRINLSVRVENLERCTEDIPVSSIDHNKLSAMVAYFKNRPKKKTDGNPFSISYVETMVRTLSRFMTWLYDSERWDGFRGWEKVLRLRGYKPILTDDELLEQSDLTAKDANQNNRFTVEELAVLYVNATPLTRSYITIALNCGFTQSEISNLMRGEIYLNNCPPIIARARKKTTKINKPIVSKWLLWDETVAVLRPLMDGQFPGDNYHIELKNPTQQSHIRGVPKGLHPFARQYLKQLAKNFKWTEVMPFEKKDWIWGRPLIHTGEKGVKTDLIKNAWFRLLSNPRVKGNIRPLPFKYLRKTGADIIREITGDGAIAQLYLSHTPTTTADRHYINPPFDRLFAALKEMRTRLNPMFAAQTSETVPEQPAQSKQ